MNLINIQSDKNNHNLNWKLRHPLSFPFKSLKTKVKL
jgi:hypothetical protein